METFLVLLAFIVACITLFIQRQHNRKELLPIIHTYFLTEIHDCVVTKEFKLINDGNGAAILKKITLHLGEDDIDINPFNDFSKVINDKLPKSKNISTSLPFCLRASSSEVMYKYEIPENSADTLDKVTVTVECESVYGDVVVANSQGFEVKSNSRDAPFELIFSKLSDIFSKIVTMATKK